MAVISASRIVLPGLSLPLSSVMIWPVWSYNATLNDSRWSGFLELYVYIIRSEGANNLPMPFGPLGYSAGSSLKGIPRGVGIDVVHGSSGSASVASGSSPARLAVRYDSRSVCLILDL